MIVSPDVPTNSLDSPELKQFCITTDKAEATDDPVTPPAALNCAYMFLEEREIFSISTYSYVDKVCK